MQDTRCNSFFDSTRDELFVFWLNGVNGLSCHVSLFSSTHAVSSVYYLLKLEYCMLTRVSAFSSVVIFDGPD